MFVFVLSAFSIGRVQPHRHLANFQVLIPSLAAWCPRSRSLRHIVLDRYTDFQNKKEERSVWWPGQPFRPFSCIRFSTKSFDAVEPLFVQIVKTFSLVVASGDRLTL